MMQCQNLYKSSSKQTIQTICILIHMMSFNFVLIIKKSDALHEHILHKIGVLFGLNSKTLSFKGIFASDMNYTEISPGIYNLQTESTYTNGISGASYCLFIQYNDKYKTQAVFHPTKGVMTRRYAGNPITWTDWV